MEFNFSMDATPRPQIDPHAPLYASVLGSAADLGGGECVFRTRDGQTHVMTHQVLQALDQCRSFLTLPEHVQSVRQTLPKVPAEGIARVLESLVARRLLISEQDFAAGFQASANRESAPPMQMLIRAGDRVDAVLRLLASLGESTDWHAHVDRIVVLNESTSSSIRSRYETALQALAKQSGRTGQLVDAADQRTRLQRMAGNDARLQTAVDTVFGRAAPDAAQQFNLALSLMAGRRSLLLDDQMQWSLHRHPEFRRGLELRAVEHLSARYFGGQVEAVAAGDGVDAIADIDAVCGARLGDLFSTERSSAWQPGDLRGVALSHFVSDNGGAPLLATYVGARGFRHGLELEEQFVLDDQSRASFSADRDGYLRQMGRGSLWSGARRSALAQRTSLLPFAIDARVPLPFAIPFGASAGATFSAMLGVAQPEALLLHLPDAIAIAEAAAQTQDETGKRPLTPQLDRFVADFLAGRSSDIRAGAPAARMSTAAAMLRDLAQSTEPALANSVSEYVQFVRSDLISKLQRAAESAGKDAPIYWLADLRAIVTVNGRALIDADAARLADQASDAAAIRDRLTRIADALDAWSPLWARLLADAAPPKGLAA